MYMDRLVTEGYIQLSLSLHLFSVRKNAYYTVNLKELKIKKINTDLIYTIFLIGKYCIAVV